MKVNYIYISVCTILFFFVFALFSYSLGFEFVWDDREVIVNNAYITSLSYGSILWAFTTTFSGNYHPLTWLSFILDYQLWGMESYGFRLVNITLHSLNSVLLMSIIYSFLKYFHRNSSKLILLFSSLIGALLFSMHPLRIESVIWVTERKDVLSTFFLLISFFSYFHSKFQCSDNNNINHVKKSYYITYIFFVLSLLSKAWAITYPVILVLFDMAMQNQKKISIIFIYNSVKQKLPFFVTSVVFAVIAANAQNISGAMVSWDKLSLIERILQASYSFNMYIVHTLLPLNLSPLYLLGKTNFYEIKFYINLILFFSFFIFSISVKNEHPWPFYILIIYFVIVSPVLGFSQSGAQIMADRYTYIALMPFYFLISIFIFRNLSNIVDGRLKFKAILICSFTLIYLIMLVNITAKQIKIWENEETLWTHAINVDETNYRALSNRGDYRLRNKLYNQSYNDYTLSLKYQPNDPYLLNARATTRIYMNDLSGALEDLNLAIKKVPNSTEVLFNKGVAYHNLGKFDMAKRDFNAIIKLEPLHMKANLYLGLTYFSTKEYHKAISQFKKVYSIYPNNIKALYFKGLSYLYIGDSKRAKIEFLSVKSKLTKDESLLIDVENQLRLIEELNNNYYYE